MAKVNITNKVRKFRFENGEMTQEELAKKVGCTRQTIVALEQNKYVPSIAFAYKISKVFGTSIEDVFQFEES